MHRGYTTPLVIAIMAFAVVAFLFLIDTSINPDGSKKATNTRVNYGYPACDVDLLQCPDGSYNVRIPPNCEFAECPVNTAGWESFTNEVSGIAFRYPPDWQVETEVPPGITKFMQVLNSTGKPVITIQLEAAGNWETENRTTYQNVTLADQPATKSVYTFNSENTTTIYSFTAFRTHGWTAQNRITVYSLSPQDEADANAILASMTLTGDDQSSSNPTAGWKTYTNTQLQYSIKYPSDWTIGLETDKQTTLAGAGTGSPFTTPSVSISTSEPDQPSSCLLKEETVTVLGEGRLRQTQGCGYAGSNIVTFIKRGSAYLSISWSEDVEAEYPTYEMMLSTFTFTD